MLPNINLMTAELTRHLLSFLPEIIVCFTIVLMLIAERMAGFTQQMR